MTSRRRKRRLAGLAGALAVTAGGVLAATIPAQAMIFTPPPPAWRLVDNHQKVCVDGKDDGPTVMMWIAGPWSHNIHFGVQGLPVGAMSTNSAASIPPGTSDGTEVLGYVDVTPPVAGTGGVYALSLWASDGTTTQSVPVTLLVAANCPA